MSTSSTPKTILFLGATGGCGLSALRRSLQAHHTCVALCRTPAKLTALLAGVDTASLRLEQGDAHAAEDLVRCLLPPHTTTNTGSRTDAAGAALPDVIVFSIGARPNARLQMDDPHVCEKGISALLAALSTARSPPHNTTGRPRLVVISTTGITSLGRDLPLVMAALYSTFIGVPHADKKKLEERTVASGEDWTIVRPSLLLDGGENRKDGKDRQEREIRVGVEDPVGGKVERLERGYWIAREDVGRWLFEEVIQGGDGGRWVGRAVSLTY